MSYFHQLALWKRSEIVRPLVTGISNTVVSSRGKSKGCLATFLERKTRFYLAFKIPDRTAKSMFSAIKQLCRLFPKEALKTFASDRGKEFACYPLVEELRIDFYFADVYWRASYLFSWLVRTLTYSFYCFSLVIYSDIYVSILFFYNLL